MKENRAIRRCGRLRDRRAIRDVDAFRADTFPCYARCAIHRGPTRTSRGDQRTGLDRRLNHCARRHRRGRPTTALCHSPQSMAASLLELVNAQIAREAETIKSIREGRYNGGYGKS